LINFPHSEAQLRRRRNGSIFKSSVRHWWRRPKRHGAATSICPAGTWRLVLPRYKVASTIHTLSHLRTTATLVEQHLHYDAVIKTAEGFSIYLCILPRRVLKFECLVKINKHDADTARFHVPAFHADMFTLLRNRHADPQVLLPPYALHRILRCRAEVNNKRNGAAAKPECVLRSTFPPQRHRTTTSP
jgi:hypothetical protein